MNNKKGFTLVELCVVIAISAIVIAIICTAIAFFREQTNVIKKNSEAAAEINAVKEFTDKWISAYDNVNYNHEKGEGYEAEYVTTFGGYLTTGGAIKNTLTFSDSGTEKKLCWYEGTALKSELQLDIVDTCRFETKNGMIYCTVGYENKTVTIAYNVFTVNNRLRYSDNSGTYSEDT